MRCSADDTFRLVAMAQPGEGRAKPIQIRRSSAVYAPMFLSWFNGAFFVVSDSTLVAVYLLKGATICPHVSTVGVLSLGLGGLQQRARAAQRCSRAADESTAPPANGGFSAA